MNKKIQYKFLANQSGYAQSILNPINFSKFQLKWEREGDEVFLRNKFQGELVFVNRPGEGINDYDFFILIEDDSTRRCNLIYLEIQRSCDYGIAYSTLWNGKFAVNEGKFDRDRCIFKITPLVDDDYSCVLENANRKVNIIQTPGEITTTAEFLPDNYEFYVCRINVSSCTCPDSLPSPSGTWLVFHQETIAAFDGESSLLQKCTVIYYREVQWTVCLAGNATPPIGSGWQLAINNCSTTGLSKYVRTPVTIYSNNPNPEVGAGNCGTPEFSPPRRRRMQVIVSNTTTPKTIYGYSKADTSNLGGTGSYYWYEVLNNPNSTYFWDDDAGGPQLQIASGQGTHKIKGYYFGGSSSGTVIVRCTETTSCGDVNLSTFTVSVLNGTSTTEDISNIIKGGSNITVTRKVCKSQSGIIFSLYDIPEVSAGGVGNVTVSAPAWTVNNGASIDSGQSTEIISVTSGTGDFTVTVSFTLDDTVNGTHVVYSGSFICYVNNVPETYPISGMDTVCPNNNNIEYTAFTRLDAEYVWEVTGGNIASGQGTGSILVNWGAATTGYVQLLEKINCGCKFIQIATCVSSDYHPSFYWCPQTNLTTKTYTHGRLIMQALEYIIEKMGCSLRVISDFFEWNAPGDTSGYIEGQNYVTGISNRVNYLSIHAKSDIIDVSLLPPEDVADWTFKDMMTFLREVFQVYWFVDPDGVSHYSYASIRLEHISWFQRNVSYDLTDPAYRDYSIGTNKYFYEKQKMPKYELYEWAEAQNLDFVGADIRYESPCVNQNEDTNRLIHSVKDVSTDIQFINESPDDINKSGFVVMANEYANGSYFVSKETGLISSQLLSNAHLSWANLHYNYHRHERVLMQGYMNLILTNFITAKRTKKQEDVNFPLCCDTIDPLTDLIKTDVGNGIIESAEYSFKDGMIKMELLHT